MLRTANAVRSVALTVAGAPQGPSDRTLAGLGLVDSPTALHFDCETKKEMCADCTLALWAAGRCAGLHGGLPRGEAKAAPARQRGAVGEDGGRRVRAVAGGRIMKSTSTSPLASQHACRGFSGVVQGHRSHANTHVTVTNLQYTLTSIGFGFNLNLPIRHRRVHSLHAIRRATFHQQCFADTSSVKN